MPRVPLIVPTVKRIRRNLLASLCLVVAAIGAGPGCGGVRARGSASPASFFLPGLMKVEPRPASVPPGEATPVAKDAAEATLAG